MQRKVEYEREKGGKAQYEGERERRAGVEPDSVTTKPAVKPAAAASAAAARSASTNSPQSRNHGTFLVSAPLQVCRLRVQCFRWWVWVWVLAVRMRARSGGLGWGRSVVQ